jgi:hypothetical protein
MGGGTAPKNKNPLFKLDIPTVFGQFSRRLAIYGKIFFVLPR